MTGALWLASAAARVPRPSTRRLGPRRLPARIGTGLAARRVPRCSIAPPISSRRTAPALMALLVREAGKTLANAQADLREAVDHLRYAAAQARQNFAAPGFSRARPGRKTRSPCMGAACSLASRPGISRSPFSPGRLPARSPPAMRWWRSRRNRPRWSPPARCACCIAPVSLPMSCTCCRDEARAWAPPWSRILASTALPSPAAPIPASPSTARSRRVTGRSPSSSPRRAASMP